MEEHLGGKKREGESDGRLQPKLLLMSGNMTERVSKMAIIIMVPYSKNMIRF